MFFFFFPRFFFSFFLILIFFLSFFNFQKIKRLTAELHLLDTADEIKNNHTIFVDTEADGEMLSDFLQLDI